MSFNLRYSPYLPNSPGYLFVSSVEDYALLQNDRYIVLPAITDINKEKFLDTYKKLVVSFIQENEGNIFAQSTPLAMANNWQSDVFRGLESFFRILSLDEATIYCTSPAWFFWLHKNDNFRTSSGDNLRACRDLLASHIDQFRKRYWGWRFALSKRIHFPVAIDNSKYILCSVWSQSASLRWSNEGREPFYGDLPKAIKDMGRNACVLFHPEDWTVDKQASGPVSSYPFAGILTRYDWLWITWKMFSFFPKISKDMSIYKHIIRSDMANALCAQIPLALISYCATKKILKRAPDVKLLTLYENNCWEQGVIRAAEEMGVKVAGFEHTSFSPSQLKMQGNFAGKKYPHKIFSSGPNATANLVKYMGYSREDIITGCALRIPLNERSENSDRKQDNILVLLQGTPEDEVILARLRQAEVCNNIIVRGHPSWPVKDVSPFVKSTRKSLQDDLAFASVVVYGGTTAVFEALQAKVPVIHVDDGSALTNDPLFALDGCAVHETWAIDEDFSQALLRIRSVDKDLEKDAFDMASHYIEAYFLSPTETRIQQFIERI